MALAINDNTLNSGVGYDFAEPYYDGFSAKELGNGLAVVVGCFVRDDRYEYDNNV